MVDNQIETSAVTDQRLLSVLRRVPRELFVPAARRALAYTDAPHPLGNGRTLPAPAVFARLVQLAGILETDRVLDHGAGNGYSTAVLAGLAREVLLGSIRTPQWLRRRVRPCATSGSPMSRSGQAIFRYNISILLMP